MDKLQELEKKIETLEKIIAELAFRQTYKLSESAANISSNLNRCLRTLAWKGIEKNKTAIDIIDAEIKKICLEDLTAARQKNELFQVENKDEVLNHFLESFRNSSSTKINTP
jgi:hypothetical protein